MDQALARIISQSARQVIAAQHPTEAAEFELVLPALLLSLELETSARPPQLESPPRGLALADAALARDHSALVVFIVAELAEATWREGRFDPDRLEPASRALSQSIPDRAMVECAKTVLKAAIVGSGP